MFYLAAFVLTAAAGLLVLWPLLRSGRSAQAALAVIFLVGVTVGTYLIAGRPDLAMNPPLSAEQSMEAPNVEVMVERLSARLKDSPDDPQGWAMLGRSYFILERYTEAAQAYAKAIELTRGEDPELLAAYAEARVFAEPDSLNGEAGRLFERVLVLDSENPRGLWYGGLAARNRGDREAAVTLWQQLLAQDLPDEFRRVVIEGLAEISPDSLPAWLRVKVTVAGTPDLPENAALFVFIRDPAQANGMPLAARKVLAPKFPVSVSITEAEMLQAVALPDSELEVGALLAPNGDLASVAWQGIARWQPGTGEILQLELEHIRSESLRP